MTDEQFLARVARVPALPDDLRSETGRRRMNLARQRQQAQQSAGTELERAGCHADCASPDAAVAGAAALREAVLRPNRWVALPRGHSANVWRRVIAHAVDRIEQKFDAGLASTLAVAHDQSQGTHLRTVEERGEVQVEIKWQPAVVAGADASAPPPHDDH